MRPTNDVWDVRWRWATVKPQLQAELRAGVALGEVELGEGSRVGLDVDGTGPMFTLLPST